MEKGAVATTGANPRDPGPGPRAPAPKQPYLVEGVLLVNFDEDKVLVLLHDLADVESQFDRAVAHGIVGPAL